MGLPLASRCPICNKKDKLLRCQDGKAVPYCGPEHRVADRDAHISACNAIRKAQQDLDREEQKLRNHPGDFLTPPNLFAEHAGPFWLIVGTQDYIRARYALVKTLLKVNTRDAVQIAHDHVMDMLRLCRIYNMGVSNVAPALFLRLDKDQECYDFDKWWQTCNLDGNYDWGDIRLHI